jgi:hypothetical protein
VSLLGRDEILRLFEHLSEELQRRGTRAEVFFTSAGEGLDLVEAAYPGRPIPPRVQFLLEEFFGPDA